MKDFSLRLFRRFNRALPTALVVAGSAAVSWGVALIYLPAGLISAGVLAIAAGVVNIIGGDENG